MTMNIQPQQIGSGEDIITNTTTLMEKKRRGCKRKDCSDTNISTEMQKKKRACKRKDCSDTNTATEMEKKEKKRKDCGDAITSTVVEKRINSGDTITSTVMVKRIDSGGTITPIVLEKKKKTYRRKKFLPHDLILEEILTKLPVPTLLKSVLVSKLWYNSIHNDHKSLTYSHLLQSQRHPQVILSLLNVRARVPGDASYACHFFKFTTGIYSHDNVLRFDKFRNTLIHPHMWELVGYCNGLPCVAQVGNYSTAYTILDPNRQDFLYIFYPARVGKHTLNAHIICHGFGFDPSANEYKLVSVFRTAQKELNFVVFTLGTKSWRYVTPTSTLISGHAGRPILKIRAPTDNDKSAISCTTSSSSSSSSGCLVWEMITTLGGAGSYNIQHDNSNDVEMEMLLSFNLHDEKFQFIQLPAKTTTDEQQKHLLVDYPHLLEYKGSPCIARIEKNISANGIDCPHRCRDDHQGGNSCCCCCCIVHLYELKDKVKQVWVKLESIEVRINSTPKWLREMGNLAPDPCCFCFKSTAATPLTRIFSFSDRLLLYWFNGKYLQVYNLHSKKLQLVLPSNSKEDVIFRAKMKEPRHVFNSSGDDDTYCSNMDYQLHCHEENFLSLETFIPEGVAGVDADVFNELDLKQEDRPCSAFVSIFRGSEVFYPSFN